MRWLFAISIILASIVACQSQDPSDSAIQTAIAQTSSVSEAQRPEEVTRVVATQKPTNVPLSDTPAPTNTPRPTNTPQPTSTPRPTDSPKVGTRSNPILIGQPYNFPGYGPMTVTSSRWTPGTSGVAVVEVSFTCDRPSDQICDVLDFLLGAVGASGSTYEQEFSSAVPAPGFWDFMTSEIYGGGTKSGFAGFLITQDEASLLMRVDIFLSLDDPILFNVTP